jgi:alanine racemase
MKQSRVRIEAVAEQAGVSITAVSFAFNYPDRLNSKTVTRILAVADELGYAPNPYARALHAKSLGVVGILTPHALPSVYINPFFANFYEGVGRVCEENQLSLTTLSPVAGSLSDTVAKVPVDGLIVVGLSDDLEEIEVLRRRNIPYVIVDGDTDAAPSVNVEDELGAWRAADCLLKRGHRKIACLGFEQDFNDTHGGSYGVGRRRQSGYERAFAEHGVPWDADKVIPTQASAQAGAEIFRTLWASPEPPTAILAIADVIAIGVLLAAAQWGIRVPDDLAVIGFDDITQAVWTQPSLTTIHQPIVEKGDLAARLLLSLLAGDMPETKHYVLPTELILRQSV